MSYTWKDADKWVLDSLPPVLCNDKPTPVARVLSSYRKEHPGELVGWVVEGTDKPKGVTVMVYQGKNVVEKVLHLFPASTPSGVHLKKRSLPKRV